MAKKSYGVIDGKNRQLKKMYAVIGGVTKKIKKMYAVVGGVIKQIFGGGEIKLLNSTITIPTNSNVSNGVTGNLFTKTYGILAFRAIDSKGVQLAASNAACYWGGVGGFFNSAVQFDVGSSATNLYKTNDSLTTTSYQYSISNTNYTANMGKTKSYLLLSSYNQYTSPYWYIRSSFNSALTRGDLSFSTYSASSLGILANTNELSFWRESSNAKAMYINDALTRTNLGALGTSTYFVANKGIGLSDLAYIFCNSNSYNYNTLDTLVVINNSGTKVLTGKTFTRRFADSAFVTSCDDDYIILCGGTTKTYIADMYIWDRSFTQQTKQFPVNFRSYTYGTHIGERAYIFERGSSTTSSGYTTYILSTE